MYRRLENILFPVAKRTKALFLLSLAVGLVGFNFVCLDLAFKTMEPPADRAFLAEFEPDRATLEQLMLLAREDKDLHYLSDRGYNFKDKTDEGLKPERSARYRKLLKELPAVRCVLRRSDQPGIYFPTWMVGGGISSSQAKGYYYSATPPARLYSTLDGGRVGYRHINGNWYLYYSYVS